MRILLLAEGDPETWDSWSGSSRSLVRALRAAGHAVIAGDVAEHGWRRWGGVIGSWAPNRRRWQARYHFGPAGFRARTRRARALIARHGAQADAVLQIGATFDALRHTPAPGFIYCDSNARLTARDAPAGEVAALRPDERDALVARERAVYAGAAGVFAMSDYLRRSFVKDFGVPDDKVHTVFAGANLDLDALPSVRDGRNGSPTVLFVGKQWERKGGPILLEAFRDVHRVMAHARLVVVGCTPDVGDTAGVEVVGAVDKDAPDGQRRLTELYQTADVFCMPSRFEPFGVVFVEAMLYGVPCIGSDRCAIPEIIAHGETGWIVPGDDVGALRERLLQVLARSAALTDMRRRCRERALALFTWDRVAERIARVMSN